jgi:LDH2 family malate/lactate/ureidoglycolate dehydrogenase
MMNELRNAPPSRGSVLCTGDPQKVCPEKRTRNGVPLRNVTWASFKEISDQLRVNLPKEI